MGRAIRGLFDNDGELAGLEPARLRAIRAAVSRGQAVADPRDIASAIYAAELTEAAFARVRPPWFALLNGLLLLAAAAYLDLDRRLLGLSAACIGIFAGSILRKRMLAARARRSAAANRALAAALGMQLSIPPVHVSGQRPLVRPEFVGALVATLVGVTAVGLDRHMQEPAKAWAKHADWYCAGMIEEARRGNATVSPGEPSDWEMSVIAAQRLKIHRGLVAYLHGLKTPKGAPESALLALDALVPYYEHAAARMAAGDRAGYKQIMQGSTPVSYVAHAELARAGAYTCSGLI